MKKNSPANPLEVEVRKESLRNQIHDMQSRITIYRFNLYDPLLMVTMPHRRIRNQEYIHELEMRISLAQLELHQVTVFANYIPDEATR